MRILGIDPGSNITGYGIIDVVKSTEQLVTFGQIRTSGDDLGQKLYQIHSKLIEVITEYQPNEMAIEKVFVQHNVMSALKLGQARGAAITACAQFALELHEYSALQVKQAVVGYGQATKAQVQHMISTILKISPKPPADSADALAIALTHAHTRKWARLTQETSDDRKNTRVDRRKKTTRITD
ncbi:MAG: crossover junction endodeoxyribonuclease RuvC [Coxiellaceae bacterium]|nr:crossover junction endodeoxyribonuclease RuvC [Coxiellaceae bacterium]